MTHLDLVTEQQRTLAAEPTRAWLPARLLFVLMDVVYGRRRTMQKFLVLELVARVPYQVWEQAAYVAITRRYRDTQLARRIHDRIREARDQQDNEQWHLLILEDLLAHEGVAVGLVRYRLLPQLIAFGYYTFSWLLFLLRPAWSYRLNADFEAHAEREYMAFVAEHPELARDVCSCSVAADYGCGHARLDDVFRSIALDERHHKEESLAAMLAA